MGERTLGVQQKRGVRREKPNKSHGLQKMAVTTDVGGEKGETGTGGGARSRAMGASGEQNVCLPTMGVREERMRKREIR